jgi:hypothetical protein
MRQMMQSSDFGIEGIPRGAGGGLVAAICGAPIGAVISVAMFALVVGIVQFIAKMFGGRGTFDQLAYSIAAIVTPFYLVGAIITLLSAIPAVGWCFGIVGFLAGLYVLALEVMAVKASTSLVGAGTASMLIPVCHRMLSFHCGIRHPASTGSTTYGCIQFNHYTSTITLFYRKTSCVYQEVLLIYL